MIPLEMEPLLEPRLLSVGSYPWVSLHQSPPADLGLIMPTGHSTGGATDTDVEVPDSTSEGFELTHR